METRQSITLIIIIWAVIGLVLTNVNCIIRLRKAGRNNEDAGLPSNDDRSSRDANIELGVRKPKAAYGVNELTGEKNEAAAK